MKDFRLYKDLQSGKLVEARVFKYPVPFLEKTLEFEYWIIHEYEDDEVSNQIILTDRDFQERYKSI